MEITDSTAKQAAQQLAHLAEYFVELPTRPHTGRTPPVRSIEHTAPLNVDAISHIDATVREIRDFMTAESPGTLEPLPTEVTAVYDWLLRNTESDADTTRRARDKLIYRQYLEHTIAAGDPTIVCRHRCPGCGCVGLQWKASLESAVCCNRRCTTPDGRANVWDLRVLAHEHIEAQEKLRAHAT